MARDLILNRRHIVIGAAGSAALWLSPTRRAFAETEFTRPDIASAAGQKMIDLYAKAVAAMQNPAINYPPQPQSWTFQAYMHAVPANPFDPAVSGGLRGKALQARIDQIYGQPADGTPAAKWKDAALKCWATCQHSSPYFTTWHRWYLYYFERICRKMSGSPDFALPYWNYGSDQSASLQLPAAFTAVPDDPSQTNHLYFDDRGLGFATGAATGDQNVPMNGGGFMPYSQVRYDVALASKPMFPSDPADNVNTDPTSPVYAGYGLSGRLETAPHDNVHVGVGGWMQNVPSAAGDPIFFVHHAQVDRLYASWEVEPGATYNFGSTPTDPDEKTWRHGQTAYFVDENGAVVKVVVGDAVDTKTLHYQYDKLAKPPAAAAAAVAAVAPLAGPPLELAAAEAKRVAVSRGAAPIPLSPLPEIEAAPRAASSAASSGAPAGSTLVLSGIKLLRRPPAPLSVFINLPAGAPPRLHSPYYVGTLNLFNFDLGTGSPMSHGGGEEMPDMPEHQTPGGVARFDVSAVLRRQLAEGLWSGGPITVTISTIGADAGLAPATYVTIESIKLTP